MGSDSFLDGVEDEAPKESLWKRFRKVIWNAIGEKGKFATLVGLFIVISAVSQPLVRHNLGETFSVEYMYQTLYFVLVGIVLIILPSSIKFISKLLTIEIKD